MKKLLSIIFVFITASAYSQVTPISTWISEDLGGLRFYKDEMNFDFDGYNRSKRYYMVKDTLIMIDKYTYIGTTDKTQHVDLFKFLTKRNGDKSLAIIPVNANAKRLAKEAVYQFRNIKYIKDATIKFTRIHLNAGMCYGSCPVLSIDIDNKGVYYLKGGEYAEPFKGYFKGRLTAKQLDTLIFLIQHSQIKKMYGWKQKAFVNDTPPYNLTIYHNNKRLKVQTNWAPMNIRDLISFLVSTYKTVNLVPDPEKHEFDEGPDLKY